MSAGVERQPLAQGNLFDTPLCHLALYVYRHAQSGTLRLQLADDREVLLRVQRGRIVGGRLPWLADTLLEGLLPLCGLNDGVFAFFDVDTLAGADDALIGMIDPYELLAASLQDFPRDDMVDAVLRRFAGKRLRFSQGRDVERLRLRPEHKPLLDLIRAEPATADELIAHAPLAPERARRVLYALLATNMVTPHLDRETDTYHSQIEPRSVRPGSSPSTPVAAPGGAGPTAMAPPPGDVGPAWQRLASLRPTATTSLRPTASLRPASFTQNSMLPNATPARGSGQPPAAQVSLRPGSMPPLDDNATRERRAEQLMQRGKPEEALVDIDALLALEPKRPEWLGLRAQALFEKYALEKQAPEIEGMPRSVVDAIKKALEIDPDQTRALYTKGLMYKLLGDPKKALICWKRVLRIDPKHLEAAREVRLAKLRTPSQG